MCELASSLGGGVCGNHGLGRAIHLGRRRRATRLPGPYRTSATRRSYGLCRVSLSLSDHPDLSAGVLISTSTPPTAQLNVVYFRGEEPSDLHDVALLRRNGMTRIRVARPAKSSAERCAASLPTSTALSYVIDWMSSGFVLYTGRDDVEEVGTTAKFPGGPSR